jgi:hypothetical protein
MTKLSRTFTVLIISLVLVAAVLIAGCTQTTPEVQTTPVPTTSPVVTVPPATANVSIASAVTLVKMHGAMMEAIEEALAYPLLNNTEEKSDFEAKSAEFDILATQFVREAELDKPENADTKAQFDVILVKKAALVDAAGNFFTAYENELIVTKDNVTVFEEAIDGFTSDFGPFTKAYFDSVSVEDFGDEDHARSALLLLAMHHDIIEGVEEAFGYVLLGDTEERADFSLKMQDFDDAAHAFANTAYIEKPENAEILGAYTTMIEAKGAMQTAALVMFDEYEKTGRVTPGVAEAYEIEVDRLTTAYDALLAEVLKDL